eukprot:1777906-Lingulodinium_polyedra.AAC.1
MAVASGFWRQGPCSTTCVALGFGAARDPGRVVATELLLAWVDACRSDPSGARAFERGWAERLRR